MTKLNKEKDSKTIEAIKNSRRCQNYLQSIMDSLEDELLVIDADYRIIEANKAVLINHGKIKGEVIGRQCYDISHGTSELCSPPRHICPIKIVWDTGKTARATHLHVYEIEGKRRQKYVDVIASPLLDARGNITAVTELIRDVTETKSMELKATKAQQDLMALNIIASEVSQSLDLDTVLNSALSKILEIMNQSIGGILLLDEGRQMLNYAAHQGLSSAYVQQVRCRPGEGIAGTTAQTGQAIVLEDVLLDARLAFRDLVTSEGLHAFASIPLITKGKALGVIVIASREVFRFSNEDIQLLNSIAAQVAMAVENAKLHREVQHQDAMRGELLRDIYLVQEEERRRIARELHDETCQTLTSLSTSLETAIRKLPAGSDGINATLRKCQSVSDSVLGDIHKLIYEMRPTLLDDLGLAAATRWLVDSILKPAGLKVSLAISGRERRLTSELENTLFRVIQEAMRNIVRHAGARNAEVSLSFGTRVIEAYIRDDGKGFDVESAIRSKHRPRGLGLLGMRERVELLGGILSIDSNKGGTRISIKIPVQKGMGVRDAKDKAANS